MRKRKIKHYLKTGILLFGISLLLWNCEKDEIFENTNNILEIKNSNLKINRISFEELQQLNKLDNPIKNIRAKFDVNKSKKENFAKSTLDASDGSFTILTDEILQVETDSTKTYTFRIETPTDNKSSFENFVIDFPKENYYYFYIYKYIFDEKSVDNFPYSMSRVKVDENLVNLSDFNNFSTRGTTCGSIITREAVGTEITCNCCLDHVIHPTCESGYVEREIFVNVITYEGPCGTTPEATYPDSNETPPIDNCDTCGANSTGSGATQGSGDSSSTSAILLSIDYIEFYSELTPTQKNWCDSNFALIESFLIDNNYSMDTQNLAKEMIDINIGLDSFEKLSNSPNFDPLNTPWLKQIRDYADRVFKLKDKLSDEFWGNLNKRIDALFIFALTKTALEINPEADTHKERNKDFEFKTNGKNGVGILLYEFANGQGPNERDFYFSEHDLANQFLSGDVPNNIKTDFLNVLDIKGLTFEQFVTQGNAINGGYSFSPDHTSVSDSFNKHINANWVQFFIGGTKSEYRPSTESGWIEVKLENPTSRNSLLLHQAESYPRDTYGNIPLSTIKQYFHFKLKIQ